MKNEAKHTAGPWEQKEWTESLTIFPHDENEPDPGWPLATVHKDPQHGFSADQARANANLITAAPDLLSTLEWTLEQLNTLTTADYGRGGDKAIRERLQATIGKARGQG